MHIDLFIFWHIKTVLRQATILQTDSRLHSHITFPSLLIKRPFEREGGVEGKENPTPYLGYIIILPLKMLTFLCTRSLLLSPSFWRDPAVTMHKLELAVIA